LIDPSKKKSFELSSKDEFGTDIIYLHEGSKKLKKCGDSCILHFMIKASEDLGSSYGLTMTRQIQNLNNGIQSSGQIPEKGSYSYFRFNKPCEETCDIEISVSFDSLTTVDLIVRKGMDQLPEFEYTKEGEIKDDEDDGKRMLKKKKKKKKAEDILFSEQGVGSVTLLISHDDKEYGKKGKSAGDYVIGVYSYSKGFFDIVARTVPVGKDNSELEN
jgi:hypothetical protein